MSIKLGRFLHKQISKFISVNSRQKVEYNSHFFYIFFSLFIIIILSAFLFVPSLRSKHVIFFPFSFSFFAPKDPTPGRPVQEGPSSHVLAPEEPDKSLQVIRSTRNTSESPLQTISVAKYLRVSLHE